MRGDERVQEELFSYGSLSGRVPQDHPLRRLRQITNEALVELEPVFEAMYSSTGRPSIPPAQLLRALLLQMLYSVRSERMLVEQMEYNLLFRWFVGLGMNERVWDATSFSKNRDRLLSGEVAQQFFSAVLGQARRARLFARRALYGRRYADRRVGVGEELPEEARAAAIGGQRMGWRGAEAGHA
jgi:transposase